jgi:hypothetical protein
MYRRPALARLLNQLGDAKATRDVLEPLLPREPTFPAGAFSPSWPTAICWKVMLEGHSSSSRP